MGLVFIFFSLNLVQVLLSYFNYLCCMEEHNMENKMDRLSPEELHKKRMANIEAHQWKPGQVTNPAGRPKGSKNKATIAKKWMEMMEQSVNSITGVEETLTQEDLMTLAMIKRARNGDVKAYKELMISAYGDEKNINHNGTLGLANITGMEIF